MCRGWPKARSLKSLRKARIKAMSSGNATPRSRAVQSHHLTPPSPASNSSAQSSASFASILSAPLPAMPPSPTTAVLQHCHWQGSRRRSRRPRIRLCVVSKPSIHTLGPTSGSADGADDSCGTDASANPAARFWCCFLLAK